MKQVCFMRAQCDNCPAKNFYDCLVANCCLKDDFECPNWLFNWESFIESLHGYEQLRFF